MKVRQARRELDRIPVHFLDIHNGDHGDEYEFWEGLRQACLIPERSAFGQTSELKDRLVELRNTTLLIFFVANVIWMVIIMILVKHQNLKLLGVDAVGLAFLAVYGFVIILQFLSMLIHRFATIIHVLARAPWTCSAGNHNNRVAPDMESSTQSSQSNGEF